MCDLEEDCRNICDLCKLNGRLQRAGPVLHRLLLSVPSKNPRGVYQYATLHLCRGHLEGAREHGMLCKPDEKIN